MKWSPFFAVLAVTSPVVALSFAVPIHATVNAHEFHDVRIKSDECKLEIKLDFSAPSDGYVSRAKNRNYHRFRARFLFDNGKIVTTRIFGNSGPGERTYTTSYDTGPDTCWAKKNVKLKDFDVTGCRGRGCSLPSFARIVPDYGG